MGDFTRSIVIFGAASLAAVAAGCAAMAASDVAPASWLRSVVAWGVGAVFGAVLARYGATRRASIGAVVVAAAMLIATLFAAPIDGVHRWLDAGPLHINVAALVLPPMIVGLAAIPIASPIGLVVTAVTAVVLLAQPDASQLTAFAFAASILLVRSGVSARWKAVAVIIATGFAVAGWMRPDPLEPVREVEQIFAMSAAVSPFLALIAGLALAAAALSPLSGRHTDGGLALSAYFVAVSLAPFFGWFPVPLVGLGMSFPVGWWLGVALLARRSTPS
jgi:cell division protein FtsW (lipid II flippase)